MFSDSREFSRIVTESRTIAEETGQTPSTSHLLLGLFTVENPAELVLRAHEVDESALLAKVRDLPAELPDSFQTLVDRARAVAQGMAQETRPLHLLLAIARTRGSAAHELLGRVGVATVDLAREILPYVVGPLPRRFMTRPMEADEEIEAPPAVAFATTPPKARAQVAVPTQPSRPPPARPTQAPSGPVSRVSTIETPSIPPPSSVPAPAARKSQVSGLDRSSGPKSPFALSPEDFPYLAALGRNLTELAAAGKIDPVIGRDREIEEALDILGKRRSNNPVLVGEPGVGKTAVVEGIALRLASLAANPDRRTLIEMDVAGLVAGTQLRGSLSEKLNGIKDEVRRGGGRIVVFIDEIHTLVGAGQTGEGAQDASNDLKAALARGEFPCIGATTYTEFQRYFAQDPALERRFVAIRVDEPSVADAIEVLTGVAPRYAQHHHVAYSAEAVSSAVVLSHRFVRDRQLPDKAIAVLDQAGSRAHREGHPEVTRDDVARVVARMAGVPEDRVLVNDAERILRLEEELGRRVIGHTAIVARVAHAIRRNFGGFSGQRPLASFIFLGPTGVGKTELARSLAEVVFGGADSLVRVDMSEYSESHAVAKLVGAPPGYVGHAEGGQLTESVRRRPASVVLLDEIEKAHPDSQQLVLQMLDEGHLTDGRGRRVDFTSTIVVLTSNLGAEAHAPSRSMGFGSADTKQVDKSDRALAAARAAFPPELWNRIEERLAFGPLEKPELRRIARLLATKSSARLQEDKHIRYELDSTAIEFLFANGGFDPSLGARPLKQALSRLVEGPLADRILRGEIESGDRLRVVERRGKIDFEHLTVLDPKMMRP